MVPEAGEPHALLQLGVTAVVFVAHLAVAARALTRANRAPASRAAWVAVVMLAPVVGMVAYLLLGETSIGRARFRRVEQALGRMGMAAAAITRLPAAAPVADTAAPLLELARSINGLPAVGGNRVTLLGDADSPAGAPESDCRRALDTLVKSGLVHRLESLNSFVACAEPHDHSHSMTAFAICDSCGQVTEMSDHDIDHRLNEWVRSNGFAAKKAVIEFRGICAKCRAEAA